MPPIPIYTDAPISASTAAKVDGVTPQTRYVPTTTSAIEAQPGAAAVPAPTGSVSRPQPPPTQTTQTAAHTQHGPPPPQPGAVPTAASQTQSSTAQPPPAPQPSSTATVTQMPPQMAIPAPTTNAAPTHSTHPAPPTSTTTKGPTTIFMGAAPPAPKSQYAGSAPPPPPNQTLEHPPGYVQNPYAAEMSAAQRASLEAQESADRPNRNSISGILGGGDSSSFGGGGGSEGAGSGGVWETVKGLASAAGQKAVELEETAWKKVNGK